MLNLKGVQSLGTLSFLTICVNEPVPFIPQEKKKVDRSVISQSSFIFKTFDKPL